MISDYLIEFAWSCSTHLNLIKLFTFIARFLAFIKLICYSTILACAVSHLDYFTTFNFVAVNANSQSTQLIALFF
jgi:hypothetical protein